MTDDTVPALDSLCLQPRRLRRFTAALRELSAAQDVDETLQMIVDLAVEVMDVDLADIMVEQPSGVTTAVFTEPLARKLDEAQIDSGEGPCLTVLDAEEPIIVSDLMTDNRFPGFAEQAITLGVRSVVAHPLFVTRPEKEPPFRLGALNLYGRDPGVSDLALALGGVFAAHCSTVLHAELDRVGLRSALERRDVIGQAKGVLMLARRITAEEAYQLLRTVSMERHIKLHRLAEQVAFAGDLLDGDVDPRARP